VGADLPAQGGRQAELDGLRVVAALAVLVIHVAGVTGLEFNGTPLSWVVSRGDIGVPIFFALSGALIYRPWAEAALSGLQPPSTPRYFWRRTLRILPAYWAVVVISFLTLDGGTHRPFWEWAQYLFLVQNYDPHPWWAGTGAVGLAQMWSLAVEVSFYLVLPAIAAALTRYAGRGRADIGRRARRLLVGITLLGVSSYSLTVLAYYPPSRLWLLDTLPRLMAWFAAGMAIAVVSAWARMDQRADGPARRFVQAVAASGGACWLFGALVFVLACTPLTGPESFAIPTLWQTETKTLMYTLIAAALVASATFRPAGTTLLGMLLGNRVMRFLGRISYGIFLWQFLVIFAVLGILHLRDVFHGGEYTDTVAAALFLAISALTVAVATVSYYLIERPAQRLYHEGRRGRPGAGQQGPLEREGAARSGRAYNLPAAPLVRSTVPGRVSVPGRGPAVTARLRGLHWDDQGGYEACDHDDAKYLRRGVRQGTDNPVAGAVLGQLITDDGEPGSYQQQPASEPGPGEFAADDGRTLQGEGAREDQYGERQ
jgi:peptidoglycan/LPS O-acetylase OafA/YrhL